jgi:hypothetical protein
VAGPGGPSVTPRFFIKSSSIAESSRLKRPFCFVAAKGAVGAVWAAGTRFGAAKGEALAAGGLGVLDVTAEIFGPLLGSVGAKAAFGAAHCPEGVLGGVGAGAGCACGRGGLQAAFAAFAAFAAAAAFAAVVAAGCCSVGMPRFSSKSRSMA